MINIRKEITNPRTLYRTKAILYRTRTEKGLEAYRVMKRLVYVAYRMGGNDGFITCDEFLKSVLTWLDRGEGMYNFTSLTHKSNLYGTIFGIDVGIVVNGTYAQIEQELLNKSEELNEPLNWISL
jgi:hypothetical protein